MELRHALGWVNSHIILGLVFIAVLHPIAYIMRLTGYDPLRRRREGEKTYSENREDHRSNLTRIFQHMGSFLDLVKDIWDFLRTRENTGWRL